MPPRRRRLATLLILTALAAVVVVLVPPFEDRMRARSLAEGPAIPPDSVLPLGALPRELGESSGLAVSRTRPGVLWTHNDSGDRPRVFAVDAGARLLGTWTVEGADAIDWEDVALGPCPERERGDCLYLADTGDNGRRRDVLTVYVVPEPDPVSAGGRAPARRVRFTYPDERHDSEALAVGPAGDLALVTKGRTGSILLFVLDADAVRRAVRNDSVVVLPPGRVVPIRPDLGIGRSVTGAAIDDDGSTLAVRTYTELYRYEWPVGGAWRETAPPCLLHGVDRGGEGVAFAGDGGLLLSSEASAGRPAMLTWVRCAPAPQPAGG